MTNLPLKSVHYNRVIIDSRVCYNRVSLCVTYHYQFCILFCLSWVFRLYSDIPICLSYLEAKCFWKHFLFVCFTWFWCFDVVDFAFLDILKTNIELKHLPWHQMVKKMNFYRKKISTFFFLSKLKQKRFWFDNKISFDVQNNVMLCFNHVHCT